MSAKVAKPAAITSSHLIKPETLAPASFSLPKIPQKLTKQELPPVQLAMAEIVEHADEIQVSELLAKIVQEPEIQKEYKAHILFEIENVKTAFYQYAEKLSPSIKPLVRMVLPTINGNNVAVKLTAQQIEMIDKIKVEWQSYLREYFNLPNIFLEIIEDKEIDTTRKAYTSKEQLDELVIENPILIDLIQKFNLKIK